MPLSLTASGWAYWNMARDRYYTGPLSEPEYPPTLLTADAERTGWAERQAAKTLLLFQHFGIAPDSENAWQHLALALAARHVPGLGLPPKPRGHPMDYDFAITLLMRVELLKRRDHLTVRAAIERLAVTDPYKAMTAEALRTRYREGVKNRHLKTLFQVFNRMAEKIGEQEFIESLVAGVGEIP